MSTPDPTSANPQGEPTQTAEPSFRERKLAQLQAEREREANPPAEEPEAIDPTDLGDDARQPDADASEEPPESRLTDDAEGEGAEEPTGSRSDHSNPLPAGARAG